MHINIMLENIMFICIINYMDFLNRQEQIKRLDRTLLLKEGSLLVVYGRRRVGKTRLLLEWCNKHNGLYWVADESLSVLQRANFARTLTSIFNGFDEVVYPSWDAFLQRFVREAKQANFKGPIVIDEFPYLAIAAPEFASVFQKFLDQDFKNANICVVICGSSQRMMQGLVLSPQAPLYGRAREIINLKPLPPGYLKQAFPNYKDHELIEFYALFGGIPRYWELAKPLDHYSILELAENLILDPLSPLFEEANRLLLEEMPPAIALKPILDVVGTGVHKLSEIASRLEQPATSLSRPLKGLQELGLIKREVPFGSLERDKRALYKINDEFSRFWYSTVGPNRSIFAQSSKSQREDIFKRLFPKVVSENWEILSQWAVSYLLFNITGQTFQPAMRYWQKNGPEWDIVSMSMDKKTLVLGECKWSNESVKKIQSSLIAKGLPYFSKLNFTKVIYCLFVPQKPENIEFSENIIIFDAKDVLRVLV